jgi:hypothetical protein
LNPYDRTLQSVFVITGQGKTPQKPVKANLKEKHFPFHSYFLIFSCIWLSFSLFFSLFLSTFSLFLTKEVAGLVPLVEKVRGLVCCKKS